jgi:hypothetical protein
MVQSEAENFFSSGVRKVFSQYITVLERYFQLKMAEDERNAHKAALREFVPSSVSALYLSGQNTRISSFGFFGCIDLVGSSALLQENGDEWFRDLARNLSESLSKSNGVNLASMNWDAFYFSSPNIDNLLELYKMCSEKLSVVCNVKQLERRLKFRLCVTFGDTSQDFCEANGFKRWTVVGAAMATVCKFEQSVKHLGEGVFLDTLAFAACPQQERTLFHESVRSSGIYLISDGARKVA